MQPLNKYTFKAPKIRAWVIVHCKGNVLNLFAGPTMLGVNEVRVDLDKTMKDAIYMDALDFVKLLINTNRYDTIVIDPPYSYRKSMELYKGHRNSRFKQLLDEIPKILKGDGRIITFGYHSSVMGKKRGFKIVEILLISHGGAIHDTIATVEERI